MIDPIVLIELTNLKASGQLVQLAAHPYLGMKPEWVGELAEHEDHVMRWYLASNPTLVNHPEILQKLATDEDPAVRSLLARNPAIANYPEIIERLCTDDEWPVRWYLALNPAIPARTANTQSLQPQPTTKRAPSI
ncbi:hypothetical protein [Ferrimicrobium acidiphilum]|uniref:hypothetical protein n=1 Tax=Ferrimicrobium acidiphilum TaxID=121039 RepID=UPI0023F27EA0|nr:hypothetical protein [Ferrimicrobium acidiphilum]